MSVNPIYLTAAYGRVYHERDAVLSDWFDGKDFRIYQGPYCSIRDVFRMKMSGFTHIYFIYQNVDNRVLHETLDIEKASYRN
jgi:hypothetical protein